MRRRVRFFKKIKGWILKSERIRKWILRFFTKQINPKSRGSQGATVKGTEESTFGVVAKTRNGVMRNGVMGNGVTA